MYALNQLAVHFLKGREVGCEREREGERERGRERERERHRQTDRQKDRDKERLRRGETGGKQRQKET